MPSKEEIIQRVGEDLYLVPIAQPLEDHDKLRIEQSYNEAYALVKSKELDTWGIDSDVPDLAAPYFCLIIEEKLLTVYSVPDARYARIKTDAGQDGELALRKLAEATLTSYESINDDVDF